MDKQAFVEYENALGPILIPVAHQHFEHEQEGLPRATMDYDEESQHSSIHLEGGALF